ncbi:MAG: hypothetical protein SOI13_01690 [Bifidobacterium mongoliense]|jgi:hypothetical protein|uniref:hypothetical protein n=1 Tax=Bifidobacterium mongoliense TaxID=518643 RepID=UPI002F35A179
MTRESDIDQARTYLDQTLDTTGEGTHHMPIGDDLLADIGNSLPDDEWTPENTRDADRIWHEAVTDWQAKADAIRSSCQLTGRAQVKDITITPNTEFIARSAPMAVKLRQLTGWPASPHWYVTLTAPDGVEKTFDRGDLDSWEETLSTALQWQGEYEERRGERRRALMNRRLDAEKALRDALEAAEEARGVLAASNATHRPDGLDELRETVARMADLQRRMISLQSHRDEIIAGLDATRYTVADICDTAGISRPRYYQIRKERES